MCLMNMVRQRRSITAILAGPSIASGTGCLRRGQHQARYPKSCLSIVYMSKRIDPLKAKKGPRILED